ncbi:hypothetical protein HPB50_025684 [Hyalomma asiaticum]|uniref:Uncharacterized protein n=1 Tax=Hyalomma asiaticum TaxID=266040 RepID=A0ACB7TAS0_HYAAI|nr:hypothetical protein HPB50_025684 [Hyalomma asiaticum]
MGVLRLGSRPSPRWFPRRPGVRSASTVSVSSSPDLSRLPSGGGYRHDRRRERRWLEATAAGKEGEAGWRREVMLQSCGSGANALEDNGPSPGPHHHRPLPLSRAPSGFFGAPVFRSPGRPLARVRRAAGDCASGSCAERRRSKVVSSSAMQEK